MLRPASDYGIEGTEEKVSENLKYIQQLLKVGILTMAGRFAEVLIGLAFIEAKSREHALEIMKNDPAVKSGIFHAELYPWRIALKAE